MHPTAREQQNAAEWCNPANWHGGSLDLYFGRGDSRAIVPKRHNAVGFTINFANPLGAGCIVAILVLAGALVAWAHGVTR